MDATAFSLLYFKLKVLLFVSATLLILQGKLSSLVEADEGSSLSALQSKIAIAVVSVECVRLCIVCVFPLILVFTNR